MAQQQELDQEAKWRAAVVHGPVTWGMHPRLGHDDQERPFVECACGWGSRPGLRWWEDVGAELDEHLKAMKGGA